MRGPTENVATRRDSSEPGPGTGPTPHARSLRWLRPLDRKGTLKHLHTALTHRATRTSPALLIAAPAQRSRACRIYFRDLVRE
jgi:hypothetical protein